MTPRRISRATASAAALILVLAPAALAQTWSERTVIRISEPMLVPGATLSPGTYEFRLVDSQANRHIVQIRSQDGSEVVTTALSVPIKRDDPKGDVVLKVNPTDRGTPAMSAWFYPGTIYGHQFVYPDEEARKIADRTRTVVLSQDVKGSDMQRAQIYVYDPSGNRTPWKEDTNTTREWNQWRDSQHSARAEGAQARDRQGQATTGQQQTGQQQTEQGGRAMVATPGSKDQRESTTAMITPASQGTQVALDALESNPRKYIGQTVSVDAEVDEVLGPRVFKIDEPNWADLDGEVLVFMPSHLAALVSEHDRVTVTGTLKPFVRADFEREWGWFDLTPDYEVRLSSRPVLVATSVVGGNDNLALMIETAPAGTQRQAAQTGQTAQRPTARTDHPVGTTGTSVRGTPVTNLQNLADAGRDDVGRNVRLQDVRVDDTAKDRGFWVRSGNTRLFVLPSDQNMSVSAGQTLTLDGVLLRMPRTMQDRLQPGGDWNDDVYILATSIGRQ